MTGRHATHRPGRPRLQMRSGKKPAKGYHLDRMRGTSTRLSVRVAITATAAAFVVAAALLVGPAAAQSTSCPVSAAELSPLVGRTLARVNLGDPNGNPSGQCSFAVQGKGKLLTPQIYLTFAPGDSGDLHDLYAYYLGARSKLATRPRVVSRPDLGQGAFALAATTTPVTSAFFLIGKNQVATLSVDLTDAPTGKRDTATADKVFSLFDERLS